MNGGTRTRKLAPKAKRQEMAAQGSGGHRANVKMHPAKTHDAKGNRLSREAGNLNNSVPGGPVTLPPNPAKLERSNDGCKYRHTRGK